jgi:hypothetical protein
MIGISSDYGLLGFIKRKNLEYINCGLKNGTTFAIRIFLIIIVLNLRRSVRNGKRYYYYELMDAETFT